ncbi:MAG TPA: MFS transporter [Thermoplasmata archaeon]|nr:MFS transporter [Thermoplasmata archaeon]
MLPETHDAPAQPPLAPARSSGVLGNANFRRLYIASVTSAAGASIAIVSLSWLVYTVTKSALAVSYVGLAGVAPGIALGLIAGALADRYNRRRVMVLSDVSRAALMAGLAGFLFLVGFDLFVILGVVVLVNGFSVLFFPASSAILPRLVKAADLEPANGLLYGSTQAAQMLGSAAGGAAIAVAGVVPGLAVNALTYAISAAFVLQIASTFGQTGRAGPTLAPRRSLTHDIGEGMSYMRTHLAIFEVTLGFLPGNLFWTMVTNFTVVYVATYFPGSPSAYGYLVAGLGGGFALGALVAVRLKLRRYAGLSMALIVVLQGGIATGLTFSHVYPLSLVLAILLGIGAGVINTVYYATIQAIVPDRVLGRVLSVDQVGSFAGIPGGLVLGGVLATEYGVGVDYLVAGLGLLGNGLIMLALRDLRGLRYRPEATS